MTSITLDLFSGKGRPVTSISVPVVSLSDYHDRLSRFVKKRTNREPSIGSQHKIVCREIFQTAQREIFFFPCCCRGKHVSLDKILPGKLFFLKGIYDWNFILIFTPEKESTVFVFRKILKFTQENTYPEGANNASLFSLSAGCASILVSEHGCIAEDSEGKLFFQGITVSVLQTVENQCKSVFVQRKDIFVSPKPSLREEDLSSLEPRTCKVIKISCFCRTKDFSYSTHFSVLTPEEIEEKLNNNAEKRLEKYGASSLRYRISDTKKTVSKEESSNSLLIVFPPVMEADVPFGSCREGELFFSYSDQSSLTLQLLFLPCLLDVNQIQPRKTQQCVENWHIENIGPLVKCCEVKSATFFSFPGIKLVSSLASEYKISGMKIVLVSAPRGNCWGIFCSPEKKIPLSASFSKSIGSIDNPTPGTSGLEYSEPDASLSQPTATVSVSPERQGKQTQKRKRSPVPGPSGIERRKLTANLAQSKSIVSVSLQREGQHTQQRGRGSPISGPSESSFRPYPQPWSSEVRHHPYFYGPLPFCGDRSSIIPHSQTAATVSFPPDRQGQQTQQRSRSPVPGPSRVSQMIRPIPIHPQTAATVSFPPDRQGQQTQQRRNSPVPGSSEGSSYPYLQYGPWPFNGGPHPYFYPEAGSFVGGFYPYGSSLPPYPHPSATQNQWMPVFSPPSSARFPVAALDLLRYDIPVQEGVRYSGRAEEASAAVLVGAVQQTSIWRPYEASSSAEFFPQTQIDEESFSAENFDEDIDLDVDN